MRRKDHFEILDRELAQRINDGIVTTLYWVPKTVLTYVTVLNETDNEFFRVDVPEGTSPNRVFKHPYAYKPADENDP